MLYIALYISLIAILDTFRMALAVYTQYRIDAIKKQTDAARIQLKRQKQRTQDVLNQIQQNARKEAENDIWFRHHQN